MDRSFPRFWPLVLESLTDPRSAARQIIGLNLPSEILWQIFAVVILISVGFVQVFMLLAGSSLQFEVAPGEFQTFEVAPPLMMAMGQGGLLALQVFCTHWIGRMCQGTGRLTDALALTTWHQFLMLILPIGAMLISIVMPPLALLAVVLLIAIYFYTLTLFIAEIHGFASPMLVFLGVIASMITAFFALAMVVGLIAVIVGAGGTANV